MIQVVDQCGKDFGYLKSWAIETSDSLFVNKFKIRKVYVYASPNTYFEFLHILEGYNYMEKSKYLVQGRETITTSSSPSLSSIISLKALPSTPLLIFKETLVCMCLVERWAITPVS